MRYYAMTWRFLNNVRNIRKTTVLPIKYYKHVVSALNMNYFCLSLCILHYQLYVYNTYLSTYNIFTNFSKNVVPQSKSENVLKSLVFFLKNKLQPKSPKN